MEYVFRSALLCLPWYKRGMEEVDIEEAVEGAVIVEEEEVDIVEGAVMVVVVREEEEAEAVMTTTEDEATTTDPLSDAKGLLEEDSTPPVISATPVRGIK